MNAWPIVVSIISGLIALASFLRPIIARSYARLEHLDVGVHDLEERCSLLEVKIGLFWRLAEEHLSQMLKKPIHQDMDSLLDKLREHTISLQECYTLRGWIQSIYLDSGRASPQERLIAVVVLAAIESLILELQRR